MTTAADCPALKVRQTLMASDPITLPIAAIQHDFLSVVSDADSGLVESEDIWLSCYKADEPSVHGKVTVTLGETSRLLELHPRDGVGLSKNADGTKVSLMRSMLHLHTELTKYAVDCEGLGIHATALRTPRHTITDEALSSKVCTPITSNFSCLSE